MTQILCRITGAPRSAFAIANGNSGSAGHAIVDKCSGSTNRGDCNNGKKIFTLKVLKMMPRGALKFQIAF